ncbi:MAG: hypothetical protein CMO25_02115 [Thiotrichales bacterium]|jgi:hypothetical protein|nr:hypothetical protein [Thiotrichales bacterium]MDP6163478.1 twin transmembrane helix small protein [Candidatus Thioglobus sp.]|tara:strand:+ start:7885 stop:8094 length:210 start_codon:yes stop_codon:yes gene_type:complete
MNIVIIAIVIIIFFALGWALLGMLRGGSKGSDKMYKALRLRIGMSVFLFILLMFASYMGWIQPNNFLPA